MVQYGNTVNTVQGTARETPPSPARRRVPPPATGRDPHPPAAGTGPTPQTHHPFELVRAPAGGSVPFRPGEPLPRLRILRAPLCEPEYDPADGVVIPFPTRPPVVGRPRLRLVGADGPPPEEPDSEQARCQVRRFAIYLTETLAGRRPLRQLTPYTTSHVRAVVEELRQHLNATHSGSLSLVASNATAPAEDTAEGFLRLRLGPDRFQAVAVRLDHRPHPTRPDHPRTWICTALHYR
ncbi:Rv3235 family protein [Yinghuangia sp. YIM S09857]|uniref:Rv3235 family protein n=1 Tax=Yinghuangia sp. YIM S09857 TaxID=3436929 RepID=UPI003F534A54